MGTRTKLCGCSGEIRGDLSKLSSVKLGAQQTYEVTVDADLFKDLIYECVRQAADWPMIKGRIWAHPDVVTGLLLSYADLSKNKTKK